MTKTFADEVLEQAQQGDGEYLTFAAPELARRLKKACSIVRIASRFHLDQKLSEIADELETPFFELEKEGL